MHVLLVRFDNDYDFHRLLAFSRAQSRENAYKEGMLARILATEA